MKILCIFTGGTIACEENSAGYSPRFKKSFFDELTSVHKEKADFEGLAVFNTDSSNMTPEYWQTLAREVYARLDKYDGFIITHGTDTMEYTASALTLMLGRITLPVVLTGSQLPLEEAGSDGYGNFAMAVNVVLQKNNGVHIAFGGRIIPGFNAYKRHTTDFDAFRSRGEVCLEATKGLRDSLCEKVFLLKLTPNLSPEILEYIAEKSYKGIVVEGFGLGGIPDRNSWLEKLGALVKQGVRVIFVTACPEGSASLEVYSNSVKAAGLGIEDGKSLTPSSAVVKLMWEIMNGNMCLT